MLTWTLIAIKHYYLIFLILNQKLLELYEYYIFNAPEKISEWKKMSLYL